MSFHIETGEEPALVIRRIVREQLERALRESDGLGGQGEAKAVHSVRKRLKKIRAVLRLVKKETGPDVYREENQRLRTVAHSFSDLRDANVQLQVLEKLREETGSRPTRLPEHSRCSPRSCGTPLDHRTPETLHSWRKHTKQVWYQARILQQLQSAVICEISEDANTLGGHLGDLHDLAFLREQLKSCEEAPASEREIVFGLICAREKALEQISLDLGCRFYAEKPSVFRRRLLRYAHEWPPLEA